MTYDSDTFWEPWQPEEGDRVRLRINPECRGYRSAIAAAVLFEGDEAEEVWIQHGEREAGQTGVVSTIWEDDWLGDGHRFYVRTDGPRSRFLRVAAGEIELIE